MLLLTPDLRGNVGGVANYYNVLRLHELADVEYFHVNRAEPEPPVRRAWRLAANYARFAWRLATRRYSLIHLNPSLNANSFYRDGLFLLIARMSRAPKLVFFRGWEDDFAAKIADRRLLRTFFDLTYGSCRNFIVLGNRFVERLRALGVSDARIWVETTVADARPQSPDSVERPSGSKVVLFMSRLLYAKGVQIAIDAVARYEAARSPDEPALLLRIAGTGADEAAVRRHVAANGYDFVSFLGHVSGDAKWRALEDADIFLFPTCYPEGLSNAVLEAMLHGLPIVARPEGALDEVLVDDVHGFVTDSRDPAVFAGFLETLVRDEHRFRRISAHNREEAERRFTRDKVAARILRIYDQVEMR